MPRPLGIDAVVVGTSWGGLAAISTVLKHVPGNLGVPVILCQHQYPHALSNLSLVLRNRTKLKVVEIEDKMPVEPGTLYVCPPNYHTLIERDFFFALSVDAQVMYSRPAIDVLFETAAEAWQDRLAAVVLTGANEDGAAGLQHVVRCGGMPIVQLPASAEAPVMPEAAVRQVPWSHVMTLDQIGQFIGGLAVG